MAGAARIGSLHVMLGLNSAEFDAGLKQAKAGLGNFGKFAGKAMMGVAVAGAAAGAALAVALKGAIDRADSMGELAQSIGVSVEALSSLGFAAKMSGTDLETLSTGLRKLSQNMLTVAQGSTGPVATAINALGISVQGANGMLLSSDQVLIQVADKFSRMEDGALKTALAVQLFGRSGAELIPLLNQGRDGIGALTAEADRLGITLSSSTASAAGQFNDVLDRLSSTFDGVINKIMEAALPALTELASTLASPEFAASAQQIGSAIVQAMDLAARAVIATIGAFNQLRTAMEWANNHDMFGNEIKRPAGGKGFIPFNSPEQAKDILREKLQAGQTGGPGGDFFTGIFGGQSSEGVVQKSQQATDVLTDLSVSINDVATKSQAAAGGASALKTALSEGKSVFEATRTPAETYALEVERLNGLLKAGAIDQDTYNRAVMQAQDAFQSAEQSGGQLASTLSGGLSEMFKGIVTGSKSATDAVGDLLGSLADLFINQAFNALVGSFFGGFKIPGFANGTRNAPGGMALVGERGPEIVNLPRGSKVTPNSALNSSGNVVDNRVYNIDARGAQIGVAEQIVQAIKANNKQLPNLIQDINMRQG